MRKFFVVLLFLVFLLRVDFVLASEDHLVINEIQTGGDSASDEFVELYNPTQNLLSLDGLKIQYKSATGTTWTTKVTFEPNTSIYPYSFYLIGNGAIGINPDKSVKLGLASAGGHLRIYEGANTVDLVGYGTADSPEGSAILAPSSGGSIERDQDGVDTDNNGIDFIVQDISNPTNSKGETKSEESSVTPVLSLQAQILINELLPNPASPQTDSNDEFIELYNPNDFPVDLSNWITQDTVGSVKKYTFPAETSINAFGYTVLYSRDSRISLNNSGDLILLYDQNGALVSSSENYGEAPSGWSFSFDGTSWGWSEIPTPGALNVISTAEIEDGNGSGGTTKTKKKSGTSSSQSSSKKSSSKNSKNSNGGKEILGADNLGLVDNAPDVLIADESRSLGILFMTFGGIIGFGYLFYFNKEKIYERFGFFKSKSR